MIDLINQYHGKIGLGLCYFIILPGYQLTVRYSTSNLVKVPCPPLPLSLSHCLPCSASQLLAIHFSMTPLPTCRAGGCTVSKFLSELQSSPFVSLSCFSSSCHSLSSHSFHSQHAAMLAAAAAAKRESWRTRHTTTTTMTKSISKIIHTVAADLTSSTRCVCLIASCSGALDLFGFPSSANQDAARRPRIVRSLSRITPR